MSAYRDRCLIRAVVVDDERAVRVLLGAGADPNARSGRGWAALHDAAARASVEVVRLLLEAGADPNAATHKGATPLHVAARLNRKEVVWELLLAGADPGARDDHDRTPEELAREAYARDAAMLLAWYAGAAAPVKRREAAGG